MRVKPRREGDGCSWARRSWRWTRGSRVWVGLSGGSAMMPQALSMGVTGGRGTFMARTGRGRSCVMRCVVKMCLATEVRIGKLRGGL